MSRPEHRENLEWRRVMLRTALGPVIAAWRDEPRVIDALLNPDGSLWVERLGEPRIATGTGSRQPTPSASFAWRGSRRRRARARSRNVSAEPSESPDRFERLLPSKAVAPMFAIRLQAAPDLTLSDYMTGAS
jgi:type IV secretion system protein TrbB